jgi:hypothetical protein
MGENYEGVYINIQLGNVGLVISIDPKYGTGMDHIMLAPATLP